MLIQLYEITSVEEATALSGMGVDHIGVLVGHGEFPREQPIAHARDIFAGVQRPAKRCALSLSSDLTTLLEISVPLAPDILHLGAAPDRLSPADVARLKRMIPAISIMRSIPVVDDSSIALAHAYERVADLLLLDSHEPADRQIGALGISHNWELDRRIVESVGIPVIVAGGLGPDNVAAAISTSRPAGVDSKSKTDKADGSHTKDLARVRAFVDAARGLSLLHQPDAHSAGGAKRCLTLAPHGTFFAHCPFRDCAGARPWAQTGGGSSWQEQNRNRAARVTAAARRVHGRLQRSAAGRRRLRVPRPAQGERRPASAAGARPVGKHRRGNPPAAQRDRLRVPRGQRRANRAAPPDSAAANRGPARQPGGRA